jgi:flavin-dependent dehydrogenase
VVIVAAGLGNQVAGIETSLRSTAAFESRVGIEAIYSQYPAAYTPGTIHMAVSGPGYVGLTQIAGKLLHVAAAVDRRVLQETGPEQLTQIILRGAGAPELLPDSEVTWRGTPPLTSSAMRLAAERVFVVGDAARYVEPFTGEGIRWALQTGIGVTPFAVAACQAWQAKLIQHWEAWYSQHIATEQRLCRRLTTGLKSPIVRWVGHQALRLGPGLAASVIARLNQES